MRGNSKSKKNKGAIPAQVARIKKGKTTFEVLTNPSAAGKYKEQKARIEDVLFVEAIFTNSKRGVRAKPEQLQQAFGTQDVKAVAKMILAKGLSQESRSERKEKADNSVRHLENYIVSNFIDARTNLPIPLTRAQNFIQEVKFNPNPNHSVLQQARAFVAAAQGVLPLKRKEVVFTLTVPRSGKKAATSILNKTCTIKASKSVDAGVEFTIGCLPGEFDSVMVTLNSIMKVTTDAPVKYDKCPFAPDDEFKSSGKKTKKARRRKK